MITIKLAVLFGFNLGVPAFYAACHFDELSRGSILWLLTLALKSDFTTPKLDFLRQN